MYWITSRSVWAGSVTKWVSVNITTTRDARKRTLRTVLRIDLDMLQCTPSYFASGLGGWGGQSARSCPNLDRNGDYKADCLAKELETHASSSTVRFSGKIVRFAVRVRLIAKFTEELERQILIAGIIILDGGSAADPKHSWMDHVAIDGEDKIGRA